MKHGLRVIPDPIGRLCGGGLSVVDGGGAAAVPWWATGLAATSDCVGAYLAKGAASLAASYVNLASPGTHDLTASVAPTFDAATGWTLNGSSQYLITDIVPGANYSAFVQFGSLVFAGAADQVLFGCYDGAGPTHFQVEQYLPTNAVYYNNSNQDVVTPLLTGGNLGITNRCYRNGVIDSGASFDAISCAQPIFIGAKNNTGSSVLFVKGNISAFAIFKVIHPDPAALYAEMNRVANVGG